MPIRRQAIIWTNADPIHWCIYTTLGGVELTEWHLNKMAAILQMRICNVVCRLQGIFHFDSPTPGQNGSKICERYFNQGRPISVTHICGTRGRWGLKNCFADDTFKCISKNEICYIFIQISMQGWFCAYAQPMRDDVTSSLIGWAYTSHYLNQWCPISMKHMCITSLQYVEEINWNSCWVIHAQT